MYNYGPGQPDPGGQFPDNSGYGSPPQQPQQSPFPDPNAYPQQPPVSPTQPYEPSPSVTSGPPAAPQFGTGAAAPGFPTAPVTGAGPLNTTMLPGPGPMAPPPKKASPAVPILAAVSALLLIGMVVFMVLFFSANSDLDEARGTIGDNEESIDDKDKKIEDLEGDKEDAEAVAEDSEECVKLVEDMFAELYSNPDTDELDRILNEMESVCQSA